MKDNDMKGEYRLRFSLTLKVGTYLDLVRQLLTLSCLHLALLAKARLHNLFCLFGAEVGLSLGLLLL